MLAFRHTAKPSNLKLAAARIPQVSRFATRMGAAVSSSIDACPDAFTANRCCGSTDTLEMLIPAQHLPDSAMQKPKQTCKTILLLLSLRADVAVQDLEICELDVMKKLLTV